MTPPAGAAARVVVVVTGGIAAYKACLIVRRLREEGAEVRVAMTRAGAEFVSPLTFAALSGGPVITSLFEASEAEQIPHVRWAEWAQLLCVAPATADFLAKMTHGIADDFASTLLLANASPMLVAPAMEDDMFRHPAVQRNLATLRADGVAVVGPATGALASGRRGPGRMSEPEEVIEAALRTLARGAAPLDLEGQHVVISAGPTYEAIDPSRGLTNRSSGRMGFALAREALWRGASVSVVAGPTSVAPPEGVALHRVESAAAMLEVVRRESAKADVAVLCAAVCDFTPAETATDKLDKSGREGLELSLVRTGDILAELGAAAQRPFLVGFAAESGQVGERAAAKLARKGCDLIVGNRIGESGTGMGSEDNEVVIVDHRGIQERVDRAPKRQVAVSIWDAIERSRRAVR